MIGTQWERERQRHTQAEGEAGSMHREPDVGFDPGSPGWHPGPKTGAKPLRHLGIPTKFLKSINLEFIFKAPAQMITWFFPFKRSTYFKVMYFPGWLIWFPTTNLWLWYFKIYCLFLSVFFLIYLKKYFIYLFMRDTQRGRDTGRGRSRPPVGSPRWELIPGPQDHHLS